MEHADVGERLHLIASGPDIRLVAREENGAAGLDRRIEVLRIDHGARQLAQRLKERRGLVVVPGSRGLFPSQIALLPGST